MITEQTLHAFIHIHFLVVFFLFVQNDSTQNLNKNWSSSCDWRNNICRNTEMYVYHIIWRDNKIDLLFVKIVAFFSLLFAASYHPWYPPPSPLPHYDLCNPAQLYNILIVNWSQHNQFLFRSRLHTFTLTRSLTFCRSEVTMRLNVSFARAIIGANTNSHASIHV